MDGNGGKFFDVQIDDLDNSGSLELLVTNHQGKSDNIKGSLFFYSLQGNNIRNATWLRTTIYDNFPVIHSGLNQVNFLQYNFSFNFVPFPLQLRSFFNPTKVIPVLSLAIKF